MHVRSVSELKSFFLKKCISRNLLGYTLSTMIDLSASLALKRLLVCSTCSKNLGQYLRKRGIVHYIIRKCLYITGKTSVDGNSLSESLSLTHTSSHTLRTWGASQSI